MGELGRRSLPYVDGTSPMRVRSLAPNSEAAGAAAPAAAIIICLRLIIVNIYTLLPPNYWTSVTFPFTNVIFSDR